MKIEMICVKCGSKFLAKPSVVALGRKYCSVECFNASRKHAPFVSNGYMRVWDGTTFVSEHRMVVENIAGRKLHCSEHVHHINGNKLDNRPENLEVMCTSEHTRKHGDENRRITNILLTCATCGKYFMRPVSEYRKSKSGYAFCSLICFHKSSVGVISGKERTRRYIEKSLSVVSAKCNVCGEMKPKTDYRLKKDGNIFTYTCKSCAKKKSRALYQKWYSIPSNRKRVLDRMNERYRLQKAVK